MKRKLGIRITACLLIVIMALPLAGIPVKAQAEYQPSDNPPVLSDFTYDVLDDNTLKITGYNGTETDITIPTVIDGKQVTRIGANAFNGNRNLRSVILQEGVTEIGFYAFSTCTGLESIQIPVSMTRIQASSFWGCSSLRDVYYLGSRSQWQEINIEVDNGNYLTDTALHYAVEDETLIIPTSISLTDQTANLTVGEQKQLAYSLIPSAATATVTYTSSHTNIASVDRTSGLVTAVTPGTAVVTVATDNGLQAECTVTVMSATAPDFVYNVLDDGTLEIARYNGTATDLTIPERIDGKRVTCIRPWGLFDKSSLKTVRLPASITCISMYAFSSCNSLEKIDLPNGLKNIGEFAFYGCSSLRNITIPASVTEFGEGAFSNCSSLEKVSLPNGLKNIGKNAFAGCSSLTNITIPASVTEFGEGAFSDCSSLEKIDLPNGLKNIGEFAFAGCSSLESISLPNALTSIESFAFYDCSNLKNIWIPQNVGSIESSAFSGCSSLRDVYYAGSKSQWQQIQIKYSNEKLTGAAIHYMAGNMSSDNKLTGITLNSKTLSLKKGSSKKLTYTLRPLGALATVTFTTSNPSVVTVDRNGLVTAKKKGTATITAKSSGLTASCKVTVTETVKLKTPSLTVKLNSANGVKLSWKKVSDAQGYYVYRATSKNGSYKQIKKVKGTSYINNKLKGGKTYYYKVAAYKGSTLSAKSKVKSKKIVGPLKAPKMKIIGDRERFTISWNNVKGAKRIQILRATGNGTFKEWKTIPAKKRKVSVSNNMLKKGVAYQFALRAYYTIDRKPIYSNRSNALSISR